MTDPLSQTPSDQLNGGLDPAALDALTAALTALVPALQALQASWGQASWGPGGGGAPARRVTMTGIMPQA